MYRQVFQILMAASSTSLAFAQKPLQFDATIKQIDASAGRITLERNGTVRTFQTTRGTKVFLGEHSGSLNDLKPDWQATIQFNSTRRYITVLRVDAAETGEEKVADDIPSWVERERNAPFDVRQFLESRRAPRDNAADLYLPVLVDNKDLQALTSLTRDEKLLSDSTRQHEIERALQKVQHVLDQVDRAQQKPECVFVVELSPTVMLDFAGCSRRVADACTLQLYLAKARGDSTLAETAIKRVLRLSRDLRPRGLLICQLVSNAIDDKVLNEVMRSTLSDSTVTAEQYDRLLSLLVEHQQMSVDRYVEGMRMEYIVTRQMIELLHAKGVKAQELAQEWGMKLPSLSKNGLNYEAEVAACQRVFSAVLNDAQRPYHQVAAASQLQNELETLANQAKANPDEAAVLMAPSRPAMIRTREHVTRVDTHLAAVQLLTAARRYERQNGHFPQSAQGAISGTALTAVPTDPFSGALMKYTILDGKATVYSTGKDLKDDGGRIDWNLGQQPGDYIFQLAPLPETSDGGCSRR